MEQRLQEFEKEVSERLLRLKRQDLTGRRGIRLNEVLYNFSPRAKEIKNDQIEQHYVTKASSATGGMHNVYRDLVGDLKGTLLERPRSR
jgi:hypothetical protein